MFIDIHTHRSVDQVNISIHNLTFDKADILFSKNEKCLYSLGFHPWHADEYSEELITKLNVWIHEGRIAIIGECGLDKNSMFPLEMQLNVFEKQIILSEYSKTPMIIHCVGCFNELLELKKRINPHQLWIIHGFRGKPELAKQLLNAGCSLSYGEHFNPESIRVTPIDQLFVETDESLLSITEIYLTISKIKKCKPEELNAGKNLIKSIMHQRI